MYLKCHWRFKDGKEPRYWSIAEKRRCAGGRVVDRHVLYLGEINASQKEAWLRCIEVFDESKGAQIRLALFPAETPVPDRARTGGFQVVEAATVGGMLGVLSAMGVLGAG
jgi:hypothetical protein